MAVKFLNGVDIDGNVLLNGNTGNAGQVLTSTGSGVQWTNPSGGIGGSGTTNKLTKWVNGTTVGAGLITDDGTTITLSTSGNSNTFDLLHTSGSGRTLNITKGGDGEGIYVNKTSGSGNAIGTNGVIAASGGNSTEWNAAHDWGNHANAGYLTSFTETDPTVPSHVKSITTTNISNWNTAYGWGNHASAGYLTSLPSHNHDDRYYTETESEGRYVKEGGTSFSGVYPMVVRVSARSIYSHPNITFTGSNSSLFVGGDVRAPIFYDSNNTGYYLNPASTSNLNELDVKAIQRWYSPGGNAHQRADARLAGSDEARLHWYGKSNSDVTRNFKHAWYDGSNYIDVTANSGGRIDFTGTATSMYIGSDRVFADNYHPNADKWTTARTLSLTGDASGSVSWDGSANASLSVTVNNDSHTHSKVYIPDTRGSARLPNYYDDRYAQYDFQNTTDTGAGGDSWHVLQTISPWSVYNDAHRQQQLAWTGTGGLKFRYATSETAWAGWQTLWTSGNDGSGSGLDADTLDGQHASAFLTSYSETDTLDSVADRGRTTNQQLISTNPSGFRVDSGSYARIEIDSNDNWSYIRLQDNAVTSWDIATFNGGQLELRPGGGSTNRTYFDELGNSYSETSKRAPIFYDSNNTSYYLDPTTSGTSAVLRGNIRIEKGNSTGTAIEINSVRDSTWPFEFTTNDVGNDNPSGFWIGSNGYPDMRLRRENSTVRALISSWERSYTTYGLTDSTDIRTPIFYTSNNTAYYIDGDGTSQLNHLKINSILGTRNFIAGTQGWQIENYNDTHSTFRFDCNDFYFYAGAGVGTVLTINEDGVVTANKSFNAPIFYDSDNTGYYLNPASTSNLNGLTVNGTITGNISGSSGYAANANLLDGINSSSFLRSDTTDYLTSTTYVRGDLVSGENNYRNRGMFGVYDSTKTAPIWAMGTAYRNDAAGTNFGNLYGLAYKHTNNTTGGTMAGSHQAVWCHNGTPKVAFGSNIWTSGNLQVGSGQTGIYAVSGGNLGVNGNGNMRASVFYDILNTAYYFDGDNSGVSIRVRGDIQAYYSSDKRYKDNVTPIENPIEKVKAIGGYTFEWNEKSHHETGQKDVGVIAQEIEAVLPELVDNRDNGYKAVDYQKLTALLIEGMKDQQKQIDSLQEQINALTNK